ncbi:MAG: hypothetical protein V3U70_01225, partial [Thermoplasmata archaeon]
LHHRRLPKERFIIVEVPGRGLEAWSMEEAFGAPEVRGCRHDAGYDCDGLFHYCHLCSTPLDDCFHASE